MKILLSISVVLLTGTLAAAQDNHIRNFQVDSRTSTHITFSWDIADSYCSSSHISSFTLYYQGRSANSVSEVAIAYSSTNRTGCSFQYTTSLATFDNVRDEYIMWICVYRSSSLNPRYTYSERKYVNIGQVEVVLEFKLYLWPSQTCSDFAGTSTSVSTQAGTEVNWILYKSCQCGLPYDFTVEESYFTCASGYVVYRAKINSNHKPSLDLMSLKANLTNFLTGQDRDAQITINGRGYLVEPGPCGLTVPSLDAAQCFSASVEAAISSSTAPIGNTTVIAIVASMCGAVVLLVLMFSGCIMFLVVTMWKKNGRSYSTAAAKSTDDQEMAKRHSDDVPQAHKPNHMYANTEFATQPNPSYQSGHFFE